MVGQDKSSKSYIRQKQKTAARLGIDFHLFALPQKTSLTQLKNTIAGVQKELKPSGLILQLPLPRPEFTEEALSAIDPSRDADCLTPANLGRLILNEKHVLLPPTVSAILEIMLKQKIKLNGKKIVIVGHGLLVGRPLAVVLSGRGATVTVCHSQTKNLAIITREADIIITAVGKYNLLRGRMIKPGAIVIDAGISFHQGRMYGDINLTEVSAKASFVTPTPGGVGPLTVIALLVNTLELAQRKI